MMKRTIFALLLGLGLSSQALLAEEVASKGVNDSFMQMQKMQDEIDKIFSRMRTSMLDEKFFNAFPNVKEGIILVDLKEFKDHYELKADIPGANSEEIHVSAKDGVLRIEAKTQKREKKKDENFIEEERFMGTFVRELTLPKDADADKLHKNYKDGVLELTIPKKS